jgi:hypothetical protein
MDDIRADLGKMKVQNWSNRALRSEKLRRELLSRPKLRNSFVAKSRRR